MIFVEDMLFQNLFIFFWRFRNFIVSYYFESFKDEDDEMQFHFNSTVVPC